MGMIVGLDHVQLSCPPGGEDAARTFWRDLLGMAEIPKPELLQARGGAWFRSGAGVEVHVGVEEPFAPARKAHPGLVVADLDAVAERLVRAGHPLRWDDAIPGRRRFHTHDAHGNRIELLATG